MIYRKSYFSFKITINEYIYAYSIDQRHKGHIIIYKINNNKILDKLYRLPNKIYLIIICKKNI